MTQLVVEDKKSLETMMQRAGDIRNRLLKTKKSHSFEQTTSRDTRQIYDHINTTNIYRPEIFEINKDFHLKIESQVGSKTSRGTNSYFKKNQDMFKVEKYPYFSYFVGKGFLLNSFPRAHFYQRMESWKKLAEEGKEILKKAFIKFAQKNKILKEQTMSLEKKRRKGVLKNFSKKLTNTRYGISSLMKGASL
jgi:hypothetical protein